MAKKRKPAAHTVPMSLYESTLQMLQDLLSLISIGSTKAEECQIAIPAAIRRYDSSFVAMANGYNSLPQDSTVSLGEANGHNTVKHGGLTGLSYLELSLEAAAEWRFQIAAKLDPATPIDRVEPLIFEDAEARAKWSEIALAVGVNIVFVELITEVVAESRRVWINGGRKGSAPSKRGRKSTIDDDLIILQRIDSGKATPAKIANELKIDISTVSKKVKRARLAGVKK